MISTALLAACASSVAGTAIVGPGVVGPTTSQITTPSSSSERPSTSGSSTSRPDTPGDLGPIPAGLDRYYQQRLAWGGCSSFATSAADRAIFANRDLQCARLTVPLSYQDPQGKTISIAVLRKPATDATGRIGSLLFNPGGPGASGTSTVGQIVGYGVADTLNQRFDLVGFDPRGIGASLPVVTCQTGPERDAARAKDSRSRTPAEVAAANDTAKKFAQDCAERTGRAEGIDGKEFLANIGTRDVAKDMDVLRAALGDRKLSYVGYSYGTRIGYVYAEQFPGNVRAMILDGAVAPNKNPADELLGQAKGFQDAFNEFAKWCAANAQPCVLGSDPARATAVYQSLVRPLLTKPASVADGRKLSFGDANTGAIQAMYSEDLWQPLAGALLDLSRGKGDGLMALADQYNDRSADGTYSTLQDSFTAIRCVDEPRLTDPAEITRLNAEYLKAAPFTDSGDPPGAIADICAFWPVPPTLTPHELKAPGLAPVLVISTTGDPATPYQSGVDLAKALNGALLSVEGTRHTGYLLVGLPCVDDIGDAYLIDLKVPAEGARCS